ncbi:Flp family type IVb pilin [Azospirillum sp.]|uniref:Flp family type IVb pilin n=1 Tax=Azospirillum sp. TaxID=34012 RepID=UPI003D716C4A
MLSQIRSLMKDESGATAIEYALLLAMVAVIVAGFGTEIGTKITGILQKVSNGLGTTPAPAP